VHFVTVIIYSKRSDVHADAVFWGLERLNVPCRRWSAGCFPAEQQLSAYCYPENDQCVVEGVDNPIHLDVVTSFWNRRSAPLSLSPALDARDRDYAECQSREHLASFLAFAAPRALWVNRPEIASTEVDKLRQLRAARQVGLTIPSTLCSNSPDRIRRFYTEQGGSIVFKSYKLGGWAEEGKAGPVLVSYTTRVDKADLADGASLAFAPGIFQQFVEKDFEVRTTIFGAAAFSVSIRTPDKSDGNIDWRAHAPQHLLMQPFDLPIEVEQKLHAFMALTGMVFCCFDLIVSRDQVYYFLEANQMGQFLWKEENLPDLPLLDAMCGLLASGDRNYRWQEGKLRIRYDDYLATGRHEKLRDRPELADAAGL